MKMKLRKLMQQVASYVEIVLSAFLLIVIMFLAGKFIVESVLGIGCDNATLEYFLENVMTFAIGVEFVKMLCTHTRSEERRVGKECRSRWSPYH